MLEREVESRAFAKLGIGLSARTAAAQTLLGAIDLMLMSAVIYVLLPTNIGTDFFAYLGVFAAALVAGVISHVPGGIGVFESVMLLGLPEVPAASLLSAILMFRCIYYLVPLSLAAIVLAAYELSLQHAHISRAQDTAMEWVRDIGPQVMAAIVFLAGVVIVVLRRGERRAVALEARERAVHDASRGTRCTGQLGKTPLDLDQRHVSR